MSKYFKFFSMLITSLLIIVCLGCSGDDDDDKKIINSTGSATVNVSLSIPSPALGKDIYVMVDNDLDGDNGAVGIAGGVCGSSTNYSCEFEEVPSGRYFIYAAVFVKGDSESDPISGDYVGIYGGSLANWPTSANATVPTSGTVNFDITLEVMP